jgi:cell division protein FtsB
MAIGNYLRVLKGNQELLVSPTEKDKYLSNGYSVINEDGEIEEQGVKSNHALKTELDAANKRVAELEAENAKLKSKRGKTDTE